MLDRDPLVVAALGGSQQVAALATEKCVVQADKGIQYVMVKLCKDLRVQGPMVQEAQDKRECCLEEVCGVEPGADNWVLSGDLADSQENGR